MKTDHINFQLEDFHRMCVESIANYTQYTIFIGKYRYIVQSYSKILQNKVYTKIKSWDYSYPSCGVLMNHLFLVEHQVGFWCWVSTLQVRTFILLLLSTKLIITILFFIWYPVFVHYFGLRHLSMRRVVVFTKLTFKALWNYTKWIIARLL